MKINYANLAATSSPSVKKEIPEKGLLSNIVDKFEQGIHKVDEYTKPRFDPSKGIDTSGNSFISSPGGAAFSGGISGLISNGIYGVPAGVIGGLVGVKAGEKAGFGVAIAAGAATGAATGAAIGAILGGPSGAVNMAISGAFSGTIGTLYGSSRSSTRDGTFGGGVVGAIVLGPAGALAGGVAAGIGGKANDTIGRAVLGAGSGALIFGALGAMSGPSGIAVGALKGALIGSAGAVIGPRINQAVRNFRQDLTVYLDKKTEKQMKDVKLKKWQKMSLGAVAGALPMAFSGFMLTRSMGVGPIGLAAGAVIGGAMGVKAVMKPNSPPESTAAAQVPTQPDNK